MRFSKHQHTSETASILRKGINDVFVRLNEKHIHQLEADYASWRKEDNEGNYSFEFSITEFMLLQVESTAADIYKLKQKLEEFNRRYLHSADNEEREQHILEFSADLGSSADKLKQDKHAFRRWFDRDAMLDRFNSILGSQIQKLAFYLDRLGCVYAESIKNQNNIDAFWKRFNIETVIRPLFAFDGDNRVRVAAFECIARSIYALPYEKHKQLVSDATIQYIYRASLEKSQDIIIQREALSLLAMLSLESFQVVLCKRLKEPAAGDDFFVRRHAVALIGQYQAQLPELNSLLIVAAQDSHASVRQRVAKALVFSTASFAVPLMEQLILRDQDKAVRAAALLSSLELLSRPEFYNGMLAILQQAFSTEKDTYVQKVLLKTCTDALTVEGIDRPSWTGALAPLVKIIHGSAEAIEVRRYSAQTFEWFWLYSSAENIALYQKLLQVFQQFKSRNRVRITSDISYKSDLQLARVLSLLAQNDHGFTIEGSRKSRFIRKGDSFKFRFWRFLHELRHPSTDKRQAHRHTTGRHYYGVIRTPSNIMCELAETKVPGEPLMISDEGGWRPFLPLVDDVLSALDQGWPARPYQLVTSEGITEILPPAGFWRRLKAQFSLSNKFDQYADQRNWLDASQGEANAYISSLRQLGFQIQFKPHAETGQADSKVTRFFAAALPLDFSVSFDNLKDYFLSVYENTLIHLGAFVLMVSAYFFGRHIYLSTQMRRARRSIPLVIGGWGTRGKSGTERLKAALFNALGYSVVSKTSGCEAMFLHSSAYGSLKEMFLFRPYDKATIWEQMNVVRLSAKLDCEVFLWECMGLTPSYVKVLQKDWMRDDIATITNTYPDHEDLQGPAGHEIPRVMTNFIPVNSVLITTEEQMLPILKDSAAKFNTELRSVGWLEAGLLTDDILQRFPYEEHPYNIALVLELANSLGIDQDFAVKEMADRVVADLGVLKTYPKAKVNGRTLQFVMGMSANERFGAMGNWVRMGFDQHSLNSDPEIWVTTVVNNRADRVPRSRVFADMIVTELSVDRHILIGNNLHGLMGYIEEAWQENLHRLKLFTEDGNNPEMNLQRMARHFRIAVDQQQLVKRIQAMLTGLGLNDLSISNIDELSNFKTKLLTRLEASQFSFEDSELIQAIDSLSDQYHEYTDFLTRLRNENNQSQLQNDFNAMAWSWMKQKLLIVEDYYASGNEVIDYIVKQTPPGLNARILGLQNIKGTGLDFVYRWQAWASCFAACQAMLSEDTATAEQGIKSLAQFREYGALCKDAVETTVAQVKSSSLAQREEIQAELEMIQSNMKQALQKIEMETRHNQVALDRINQWLTNLSEIMEAFLDAGDAVKRRKRANMIYQDLQNKRISYERAIVELQALNKRQKGGWAGEYIKRLRTGR